MWGILQDSAKQAYKMLPTVYYNRIEALEAARKCAEAFENTGTFFSIVEIKREDH